MLLVAPLAPAPTGNGLAMRTAAFITALRAVATVDVVVVPISGRGPMTWAQDHARRVHEVAPADGDASTAHVIAQMADPRLRDRLAASEPLPLAVRRAPPTLAESVLAGRSDTPDVVLGMRLGTAPLASELAHRSGAGRLVIDSDDDDETFHRDLGRPQEADAWQRVARAWLPDADVILTAAAVDARGLAPRFGLTDVRTVPNSVVLPGPTPRDRAGHHILFLGNLTYEPNIRAARELAEQILPKIRDSVPDATLDLVGQHDGRLDVPAEAPGITAEGPVAEVTESYRTADVVVLPLRVGSGTRIKALEAFAHRCPVVATRAAMNGIDAVAGEHYIAAETAAELAAATAELLRRPPMAATMVDRAVDLVRRRYTPDVVGRLARIAVLGNDRLTPGQNEE